ncbi:MAG: nitrilase-related carbon-nitrogen hydrolase [Candidatus Hydrothermarchaeales archaeon]
MRVLIAQTDVKLGDKESNLANALEIVEGHDADLFLFPELFTTGFDYEHIRELAEELPGETVAAISSICGDSLVGGSILERYRDKIYNTFILVSREGLVGSYRKMHPFGEEKEYLGKGKSVEVAGTAMGNLGLAVCYDVRFPEQFRELMQRGAEVVLVSAEFPLPRQEHWEVLLRARAIENQFFILAANRIGRDDKSEYFGGSLALTPWGDVLARGGIEEEMITVEIDVAEVKKIREKFPVLRDADIQP